MLSPLFAIMFLKGNHKNRRTPSKSQNLTQGGVVGCPSAAAGDAGQTGGRSLGGTKPLDGPSHRHLTQPSLHRDGAKLHDTNAHKPPYLSVKY